MKLHQIAFAVAALSAFGSAAAVETIWSSGASAPTKAVFNAFRSNCVGGATGAITVHQAGSTVAIPGDSGTGNFFRYSCPFAVAIPGSNIAANEVVNMYHTVDGGSFNAFAPHLVDAGANKTAGQALKRVNETVVSATVCVPAAAIGGVTTHKSCSTIDPALTDPTIGNPDGGFSDVESALFGSLIGAGGMNLVVPDTSANIAQAFAVVVTDKLYLAMQLAQGLTTAPNSGVAFGLPANPAALTAADVANQPVMSKSMYATYVSETGGGAWQTDFAPLVGSAGANKNVNVCRRVDTSGTQASSNAYFLETQCRTGALQGFLAPAFLSGNLSSVAASTGSVYRMKLNSGTSDVKTCLTKVNDNFDPQDQTVSQTAAFGGFGVGVVSAENVPTASDKWKLVKLDGVSPNADPKQRASAAQGKYGFTMETVYVVANPTRVDFFAELANDLGQNTDLTGVYVLPTVATPDGDSVGNGTKFGNNCQPLQLFF